MRPVLLDRPGIDPQTASLSGKEAPCPADPLFRHVPFAKPVSTLGVGGQACCGTCSSAFQPRLNQVPPPAVQRQRGFMPPVRAPARGAAVSTAQSEISAYWATNAWPRWEGGGYRGRGDRKISGISLFEPSRACSGPIQPFASPLSAPPLRACLNQRTPASLGTSWRFGFDIGFKGLRDDMGRMPNPFYEPPSTAIQSSPFRLSLDASNAFADPVDPSVALTSP
jgi:hypothetical protein